MQPSRAWVEVDLAALLSNARTIQSTAGVHLLPMVKANGYGLGAVAVARALATRAERSTSSQARSLTLCPGRVSEGWIDAVT